MVAVTPDLTGRIKAGQIVKEIAPIVGGAGGGRPDFAEAGGKQPEKIDEMLEKAPRRPGRAAQEHGIGFGLWARSLEPEAQSLSIPPWTTRRGA